MKLFTNALFNTGVQLSLPSIQLRRLVPRHSFRSDILTMRPSVRLHATVKSATKYLEANTPTGLTGLPTHPRPRPALLFSYSQTLQKLKQLPPSSVYRQSAEALTKQRMSVIQAVKPPGYDEWLARVQKQIDADPSAYSQFRRDDGTFSHEESEPVNKNCMGRNGDER